MEYEYRPEDLKAALPPRRDDSYKGTYGKTLVVAGSKNMCGAAYFCAKAAYRTGAGLVYIYTEECNRVILQQLIPEAVLITYERKDWERRGGPDEEQEARRFAEILSQMTAAAVGPGLGVDDASEKMVRTVLETDLPRVLDADALNVIAGNPALLETAEKPFIITPHLGEFARLTGKRTGELAQTSGECAEGAVQHCRWQADAAADYAREHQVITVLKGAPTVTSDGADCFWNTTGNHGMATGGSGDVLTGIIAGLLAQGMPLFEAAKLGVYLHGLAGDMARDARGAYAMTAGDLLDYILRGIS